MKKKVDRHKIISFDMFDTLVWRDVMKPADSFKVIECIWNKKNGSVLDFSSIRRSAERAARDKKQAEITFDEIYNEIELPENDKRALMQLERDVEYKLIMPNYEMKAVYDYAVSQNKTVIVTTDMYLPLEFIEKLLTKCGYTKHKKLYLSCEVGKRKRDGGLFKYIADDLGCKPSKILHIGDNRRSDQIEAVKSGLHIAPITDKEKTAYHYAQSGLDTSKLQNNVLMAYLYNRKPMINDDAEYLGFSLLGPALYGYCRSLHEGAKGIDKFFLARDGFLIKNAYEIMYPEEKPQLHYLCISRKALRRPNIYKTIPYRALVEQFANLKEYTVDDILKFCSVSDETRQTIIDKYADLDPVHSRRELAESKEFEAVFNDIKNLERNNYEKQYNALRKYLAQENFNGNIAISDVGWRATAQINLDVICGSEFDITGYYFGVEDAVSSDKYDRNKIKGYFWSWNESTTLSQALLNGRKAIFECMFLSSDGSTYAYDIDKSGKAYPLFEEKSQDQEAAGRIQRGALKFVEGFKEFESVIPPLEPVDTGRGLADFLMYPQKQDLVIGDILSENYREAYLAKPKSLGSYIKSPSSFKKDFRSAEWKVGFLARLLPLNRGALKTINNLYEKKRHK